MAWLWGEKRVNYQEKVCSSKFSHHKENKYLIDVL